MNGRIDVKFSEKQVELNTGHIMIIHTYKEFSLSATKGKICFNGTLDLMTQAELEDLAEMISKAWQQHKALRGENGISMEQKGCVGVLQ